MFKKLKQTKYWFFFEMLVWFFPTLLLMLFSIVYQLITDREFDPIADPLEPRFKKDE